MGTLTSIEVTKVPEKRRPHTPLQNRAWLTRALSWLIVGTFGAVEGMYGHTRYLGDAISYLNVSRAASALDWKSIFDPMWSPGYPVLVALMRALFPHTAEGEWRAITFLNWIIFLAAYGSLRYLVLQAIEFCNPSLIRLKDHPVVLWTGICAFLSCNLCLNNVSSVGPDLLVTTLFVLASGQTLALLNRPSAPRAIALAVTLGAGCWIKGVFLAFAYIFLLVLLLACCLKRLSWRRLGLSGLVYLAMVVPYIAAISISYGHFTLGASGTLNYAFHVNHVPHWTNWQGGPAPFGTPLHATQQLVSDLPAFGFGSPFRTTYPPYNNLAYWYQGFRNFFSVKSQILALGRTLYFLAVIVLANPFLWALLLILLVLMLKRDWRIRLRSTAKFFWPLYLPVVLSVASYLAVHVEDRYLSPFCLIFSMLPMLLLLDPGLRSRRLLIGFLFVTYSVGMAVELGVADGQAFRAAARRSDYHDDMQWKLAKALPSYGLHEGDPIAIIDGATPAYRCHWAYISKLRIVAEFGSLPWAIEPWDRTRFDHNVAEPGDQDYGLYFWQKLTPERRGEVLNAFRNTGAKAVVELSRPDAPPAPGWRNVTGTTAWIYRFDTEEPAVARQPANPTAERETL